MVAYAKSWIYADYAAVLAPCHHFRVFAAAQKLTTLMALEWVTRKDEQRGFRVKQFKNSTFTLGALVQRVMEKGNEARHPPEKGSIIINNNYTKPLSFKFLQE